MIHVDAMILPSEPFEQAREPTRADAKIQNARK